MPKVSVVIPSYNHERYIGKAVKSVLEQSEADLELIVVDDGSQDGSLEVLHGFTDPRLKMYPQQNCGAHAAINRGLRIATAPFLAILNSDDLYHPNRLATLLPVLEKDPSIGLCGSYIEAVDPDDRILGVKEGYHSLEPWNLAHPERSFRAGDDLRAALLAENYFSTTSNFVFSRDWYEKVGEFWPLRYAHDWDFALRASRLAGLHLYPEPLLKYRLHGSNTIRENQAAMIFEICWILAVHLPQQVTADWFTAGPGLERLAQLLNSIHVFGMDRVLAVMLAQRLCDQPELARQVLDPQNPVRAVYLQYISEEQAARQPSPVVENASLARQIGRRGMRLLRRLSPQLAEAPILAKFRRLF